MPLGENPFGAPVYSFCYLVEGAAGPLHIGAMAQDLLALGRGEAVVRGADGMLLVDYAQLDIGEGAFYLCSYSILFTVVGAMLMTSAVGQ